MTEAQAPVWGEITPQRPLIILQTSNRFNDSDEDYGISGDAREEARRHGREAVRVWRETTPDDIKPYCHLQIELRMQNHQERYERLRRIFDETQAADVPVNFQFADPHDQFVFDPEYVERLLTEYSCIKSMTLTEINYEYYRSFNVPRYAVSPEARYTMDVIDMAARQGRYLSISLQGLKWMHICADVLNAPLFEKIRAHGDYVLAVNEHIGPQHLPRQTSVWGVWLAEAVKHWGVEPQSWWFENGRMIEPGLFGQFQASNTRIMPPLLYRAMMLQGALLGATVYQFEPFWDLFDYDNSLCWREVIYPTMMEIINDGLIASREQCLEKTRVAYQYKHARDINEFHENMRDVDFIHDEGLLARAAYGVWEKYLEHELIPNKSRYFFIPLLPPVTPKQTLERFEHVIQPGECDSEAAYTALLDSHYPEQNTSDAWVASINGHTYVMQYHENLYERQTFRIQLPRPVRGLRGILADGGACLTWPQDDTGATAWTVYRAQSEEMLRPVARVTAPEYLDAEMPQGEPCRYAVAAHTATKETYEGAVNYMDYLVFSESLSRLVEEACIDAEGTWTTASMTTPDDTRPESQVVYPTFDGAEGHLDTAREIVAAIDRFKKAYDAADYPALAALYAEDYEDSNGFHIEYARRAWKWWFQRHNIFCFLRQIRYWDFSDYVDKGLVRVRLFALCRATRRDDAPFGSLYDGPNRVPRTSDEEVTFTWRRDGQEASWKIVRTDPAVPNFNEILWNNRGADRTRLKLVPGTEQDHELLPEGKTNLLPLEIDWLPNPLNRTTGGDNT